MHDANTPAELMQAQNQGSFSSEMGVLGGFAPKNKEELQVWQDMFCEMAGVYAQCLDDNGVPITEISGIAKSTSFWNYWQAALSVSARSVFSQATPRSSRPMWP